MAPTVEQEKHNGNGDLVAQNVNEHNVSVETSSSENNSDAQSFAKKVSKPRKTACNLCHSFVGNSKIEYYNHLRTMHEASGKLLYCHLCPFIALYKHHLEYHSKKHNGSKPYRCNRCDYTCLNQSMLNSHHKSHSDIYQYSCQNCSYMTKYLHSLKMHLRKYNHQPGRTLNPDGSINNHTMIDVHGKRRGPKSKKRKSEADSFQESISPKSTSSPSPPSIPTNQHQLQNFRILYNPFYNNYTGNLFVGQEAPNYQVQSPPNIVDYSYKPFFPTDLPQLASPSATFLKKDETMNEISINVDDDSPLDLSLKTLSSPETRSNGFSPYSSGSVSGASSKSEDGVIRGANRRKGRAFKLNQYAVEENDVDAIESASFLFKRSEIKNVVPRINFKPTLNLAKWNGYNTQQLPQPEFQFMNGMPYAIPNRFDYDQTYHGTPPAKTAWNLPSDSWCPFCSIDQGTACLLQIHSSFHSEKDPFTCAKCGLRCHTRTLFNAHVMSGSRINGRCINAIEYGA